MDMQGAGFWNKVQGNWMQFTGSVKERWGNLTDDEIMQIEGDRDKLVGKIQEKYGILQQEAAKQVDEWVDKMEEK